MEVKFKNVRVELLSVSEDVENKLSKFEGVVDEEFGFFLFFFMKNGLRKDM